MSPIPAGMPSIILISLVSLLNPGMFSFSSTFMKRRFLSGLFLLALAQIAVAQTNSTWVNNAVVFGAPQIDAETVINNGFMEVFLTNGAINIQLFDTSNTRNFT